MILLLDNTFLEPNFYEDYILDIGVENEIGPFVTLGTKGEHWDAYPTHPEGKVVIGNHNIIREFVSIQRPILTGRTIIGNHNFIMCHSHIAHDCVLEDYITMSPSALLAGHVYVMHHATLGLHVSVHQHRIIGSYTMIGMSAIVTKDIPPFAKFYDTKIHGINKVGMERNGFTPEEVQDAWYCLFGDWRLAKSERVLHEFDRFHQIQEARKLE